MVPQSSLTNTIQRAPPSNSMGDETQGVGGSQFHRGEDYGHSWGGGTSRVSRTYYVQSGLYDQLSRGTDTGVQRGGEDRARVLL